MQPPTDGRPSIFRKEALAHYQRVVQDEGDLLRISRRWTHWTFALLCVFCVTLVLCVLAWPALIAQEGHVLP
ncbi:hypothetical protein ACLEPN_04950 [Myxococcus sp. 1LA]